MQSTTTTPPPVLSALEAIQTETRANQWDATNPFQESILHLLEMYKPQAFAPDEMRVWTSRFYKDLNKILAENGFSIQLDPFHPTEFGVVAIMDVLVNWLVECEVTTVTSQTDGKTYPAVLMRQRQKDKLGERHLMYIALKSQSWNHPIISMKTKSGDFVGMTVADAPLCGMKLLDTVKDISNTCTEVSSPEKFIFPMIDYSGREDISDLIGMATDNGWFISQALQETKFKMNQYGARVKSAAAIATKRGPADVLTINKPFLLWIERFGIDFPIFAGYFTEDSWSDPDTLSDR